jgi:hypothetical protein
VPLEGARATIRDKMGYGMYNFERVLRFPNRGVHLIGGFTTSLLHSEGKKYITPVLGGPSVRRTSAWQATRLEGTDAD